MIQQQINELNTELKGNWISNNGVHKESKMERMNEERRRWVRGAIVRDLAANAGRWLDLFPGAEMVIMVA